MSDTGSRPLIDSLQWPHKSSKNLCYNSDPVAVFGLLLNNGDGLPAVEKRFCLCDEEVLVVFNCKCLFGFCVNVEVVVNWPVRLEFLRGEAVFGKTVFKFCHDKKGNLLLPDPKKRKY